MSNKILNKLNTIAAKGYKFFIALVAIAFIFLSFIIAYIAKQKYTVTTIAVAEPYINNNAQKIEGNNLEQLKSINRRKYKRHYKRRAVYRRYRLRIYNCVCKK